MNRLPIPILIIIGAVAVLLLMIIWIPDPDEEREFPSQEALFRELLARIDADGDGRIGRFEYERYANRRNAFNQVDQDLDGYIDWKELRYAVANLDPGYKFTPDQEAAVDGLEGVGHQGRDPVSTVP